ncbi:hypothetical protein SUGI_0201620 [Cryptomeria japonica]|nr:hypothetical protein SUGI_0201620 [Cryptomeria japonica]
MEKMKRVVVVVVVVMVVMMMSASVEAGTGPCETGPCCGPPGNYKIVCATNAQTKRDYPCCSKYGYCGKGPEYCSKK